MNLEEHQEALTKLCRVCGNFLIKAKAHSPTYDCLQFKDHLEETFLIGVGGDSPDRHPQSFCRACYDAVRGKQKAETLYRPLVQLFEEWCDHSPEHCAVCEHYRKLSKGGRPKKKKSTGRPATVSVRSAVKYIRSIAPPTLLGNGAQSFSLSNSLNELQCALCKNILNRPVELTECRELVCCECLTQTIEAASSLTCPVCSQSHLNNFSTIREASSLVQRLLKEQQVKCSSCSSQVMLGEYRAHLNSSCTSCRAEVVTVEDVLSQPDDAPLQPAERELQARLTRRSLATGPDSSVLRVKTGGQPMTFVQIRQPRRTSKQACTKTLKERSKALMSVRTAISKGEGNSQFIHEVGQLSPDDRHAIANSFNTTLGQLKVVLPASTSLAILRPT